MNYSIHTDGGSRGNPGPAAIGVVIDVVDGDKKNRISFGKTIGETTNNVAEYTAVIETLKKIQTIHIAQSASAVILQFYLDSTLVVNQLNGLFKVKDANMRMLMLQVRELEQHIDARITYTYVPREQNFDADLEVNKALDARKI